MYSIYWGVELFFPTLESVLQLGCIHVILPPVAEKYRL